MQWRIVRRRRIRSRQCTKINMKNVKLKRDETKREAEKMKSRAEEKKRRS